MQSEKTMVPTEGVQPLGRKKKISIMTPCYNEEAGIIVDPEFKTVV